LRNAIGPPVVRVRAIAAIDALNGAVAGKATQQFAGAFR
jgi:hypothetical protein